MLSLKSVMGANGLSCIGFGSLFMLKASAVTTFLAVDNPAPPITVVIVGVILVFNGFHLLWSSIQPNINKCLVAYFSLGDALWVAISLSLVIFSLWITTTQGIIATILIALMVGAFGVAQWLLLRRLKKQTIKSKKK